MDPADLYYAFRNVVGDEAYALAFCLTLRMISRFPADSTDPTPRQDRTTWHRAEEEVLNCDLFGPDSAIGPTAINFNNPHDTPQKRGAYAIVAVGIMSELIRHGDHAPEQVIAPTASDIHFHAMMDLPLPFCPYAPAAMATWHLPKMTSPHFLEDGEWMGVYSYGLGLRMPISWDPPMRGIHFTTRRDPEFPKLVFLKGSGSDRVGPFDVEGCVSDEDGLCDMSKIYGPHLMWHWQTFMTPFGLVGTWGKDGWGGWVWLWKASWQPGQA